VTGWGQHLDYLAAASAALLSADRLRTRPMQDIQTALGCRDAVVSSLRDLVGAVSHAPPIAVGTELTLAEVTQQPGPGLHHALSALPRAVPFGTDLRLATLDPALPVDERHWRAAARATISLERYVDALGRLPDAHAWAALRDLADLAAALPALDHGLSEAIRPWLSTGADLTPAYAMLTHPAHDLVRLAAGEIRARVPAAEHSPRRGPTAPTAAVAGARGSGSAGTADLARATAAFSDAVRARGGQLSVGDLRAVTRVLEVGGHTAAQVLHRAAPVVAGAADAALALQEISPLAARLRTAPARSMTTEHLGLLRDSRDLQTQLQTLAEQGQQLPGGATTLDLRRLAAPALGFAQHLPMLTQALEASIGEALTHGLMLVPSAADRTNPTRLAWVTVTMNPAGNDPPAVHDLAKRLARAGQDLRPALQSAHGDIHRHAAAPNATGQAATAARRHVGAARAELRVALGQLSDQPAVGSAPLPSHPRLPTATSTGVRR
jgi:hypothetical protein